MPEPPALERAQLRELDADFRGTINEPAWTTVQFNPETLKVTYANQIIGGDGPGSQTGPQARQFVGAGTTKLAMQLWFDVTAGGSRTDDVRELTKKVAYFMSTKDLPPASSGSGATGGGAGGEDTPKQPRYAPPAVRFLWGSFRFDGIMEGLEETLEFWSNDGRPLRASVAITLSAQKILFAFNDERARGAARGPAAGATPGTRPLVQASAGATLPGIASASGAGASWQAIASANGIEDALRMKPGQLIDLSARVEPPRAVAPGRLVDVSARAGGR